MSDRLLRIILCGNCPHLEWQEGSECACSLTAQADAKLPPKGTEVTQAQFDAFYGKLVDRDEPPPDWCPLPKAEVSYKIKPLLWSALDHPPRDAWESRTPTGQVYMVRRFIFGKWNYLVPFTGMWLPCLSLEAGLSLCQEHWENLLREALNPVGTAIEIRGESGAPAPPQETKA